MPSSGREPHITTSLRKDAAVQCGKIDRRWQRWVKVRHRGLSELSPLLPQHRALAGATGMSQKCQERLYASQQTALPLFDHFIGRSEQGRRHCEAEDAGGLRIDDEFKLRCLYDW
jgi:hypothetical protein